MNEFLPVSKADLEQRGTDAVDFIMVTGDAYVDHPSFAHALISRYLTAHGYLTGVIAQPNLSSLRDFTKLGRPRLGFLIGAGNMDSMVQIYTVAKKKREKDLYSEGGRAGRRPERAVIAYAKKIREIYGDIPIIIGGVEASLRRLAHYDYWNDTVMPSVLTDSEADLLVYGAGERAIVEIADALSGGLAARDIVYVRGTAFKAENLDRLYEYRKIPSFEQVRSSKREYAKAFAQQMHPSELAVVQKQKDLYAVINPPAQPLSQEELDFVYGLPFTRKAHPMYKEPIPALEEVKYSITATRGCLGGCSFCSIYYQQGKELLWRSKQSIVKEAKSFLRDPDFKGYIHDVGGPTANLYGAECTNPKGTCTGRRCLVPKKCRFLKENNLKYLDLLRTLRGIKGIKKVFVRSGIRHDYAMLDKSGKFIGELAKYHVSGQLKLAPEHVTEGVLRIMGKPSIEAYERFCAKFRAASQKAGKKQYVLPYFMSSHPGCTLDDAVALAEYLRDGCFTPDQTQDFYPTPGTLASCMYYTGFDPQTLKPVYVPKSKEEKKMQRALIQYRKPQNRNAVKTALKKAGREDLIGNGKRCLIKD